MSKIDNSSSYIHNRNVDSFEIAIPSGMYSNQKFLDKASHQGIDKEAVKHMSASIIDGVLPNIPKELLAKLNLENISALQEALKEFLENDPKAIKDLFSMKDTLNKLIEEIKEQNPKDFNDLKSLQDALMQLQEKITNKMQESSNNMEDNLKLYNSTKEELMQHLLDYPDSKKLFQLSKNFLAAAPENNFKTNRDTAKEKTADDQAFNPNNAGLMSLNWGVIENTHDIMLLITMLFVAMADIPTKQAADLARLFSRKKALAQKLSGGKTLLDDAADMLPLSDDIYKMLFPNDTTKGKKSLTEVLKAIRDKYNSSSGDDKKKLEGLNNKVNVFLKDFKKNTGSDLNVDGDPKDSMKQITDYFSSINEAYRNGNPDATKDNLISLILFDDVTSSDTNFGASLKRCTEDVGSAITEVNSVSTQIQTKMNAFLAVMQGFLDGASKNIQMYSSLVQTIYR